MILPRLTGPHVPRFVAAGDFERPYIVMEYVAGQLGQDRCSTRRRCRPRRSRAIGAKIAFALHDLHQPARHPSRSQAEQRHPARRRRGRADRLRPVAPRPAARPDRRGIRRSGRHRALHRARAGAARARRSAQRHLRARRDPVFPRHRRAAVRRAAARRRMAAPAVARSVAAAAIEREDPALAAGDHPALPRGRPGRALRDRGAARLRSAESRGRAAHRARRAARARRQRLRCCCAGCARPSARCRAAAPSRACWRAPRSSWWRSISRPRRRACARRSRVAVRRVLATEPGARLACLNVLKVSRIALDPRGRRAGPQSASAAAGRAAPLGARAAGRAATGSPIM